MLDGTGPFVMSSNTRGTQVVLVRNPNYWDQAGRAHLDKIIFRIEPDLATEEKDVRSGAVQVGLNLGLAALASLSAAVRAHTVPLTVDPVLGSGAEVLMFNLCAGDGGLCDNPAVTENEDTADATIRKAILLGIDREAIVKAVAPGVTTVPADSWMNSARATSAALPSPPPASTRRRRMQCSTPPATRGAPSAAPLRTGRAFALPGMAPASSSTSVPPAMTPCGSW